MRLLVIFCSLFISATCFSQTIYTADNNPGAIGGANTFTGATALQDAIAAATAGDIIHVTRSSIDYGTIIVDRQLDIFGIGLNPNTDGSERSRVNTVTIEDPVASGSRISGLHISTILTLGGIAGNLSNIFIENSAIKRISQPAATTTLTNLIIRNNVLGSSIGANASTINLFTDAHSNVIIANNVIYGTTDNTTGRISVNNGTSLENNLIIGGEGTQDDAFSNFNGNTVKNNIFVGLTVNKTSGVSGNTFEYNLSYNCGAGCAFPSTNGNTKAANIENSNPLMASVPYNYSIDFATFNPTLNTISPSPAIGNGEGGTDIGVFGGAAPMTLQGTLIPLIQSITLPSMILKGVDLPVQIQAAGN